MYEIALFLDGQFIAKTFVNLNKAYNSDYFIDLYLREYYSFLLLDDLELKLVEKCYLLRKYSQ